MLVGVLTEERIHGEEVGEIDVDEDQHPEGQRADETDSGAHDRAAAVGVPATQWGRCGYMREIREVSTALEEDPQMNDGTTAAM